MKQYSKIWKMKKRKIKKKKIIKKQNLFQNNK